MCTASNAQVGDSLPDVSVYENDMDHQLNIKEACAGMKVLMGPNNPQPDLSFKVVILGVPGAFTPVCSDQVIFEGIILIF